MDETWITLPGHPGYSVSDLGQVRNDRTGRIIAQSKNNTGYMKVSIGPANNRSTLEVTRLVALAFVPGNSDVANTPIHLDGNKEHTWAGNLAWWPRWFAAQYHQQFLSRRPMLDIPIIEYKTDQTYNNSLAAAAAFGVLEPDVVMSTANGSFVYPGQLAFALATSH